MRKKKKIRGVILGLGGEERVEQVRSEQRGKRGSANHYVEKEENSPNLLIGRPGKKEKKRRFHGWREREKSRKANCLERGEKSCFSLAKGRKRG